MTFLIFFAILFVLVISHEAGHFFSARAFKIRVEEFGFGIPPRLFGFKGKSGTIYSLNWLPFGGFVKIFGEEGEEAENQESFGAKPKRVRALILVAGVLANIAVGYLAFTAISAVGYPQAVSGDEAMEGAEIAIVEIAKNSPADTAEFVLGDKIKKIVAGGAEFVPAKISEFRNIISENAGGRIEILVERNGKFIKKNVSPRKSPPEGEGPLGVALALVKTYRAPLYAAPYEGARLTWFVLRGTVYGFYEALRAVLVGKTENIEVAGPVGIFNLIGSAASSGITNLVMFLGILSVNLAFINLLPIPGLDGGRLFFLAVEAVRKKQISSKISARWHGVGLALLIVLMALITYNDIAKFF